MSFAQGQTAYNIFPIEAVPGQLMDEEFAVERSFCASTVILPGTLVEYASDGVSIKACNDTSDAALSGAVGVAILNTAREGSGQENLTTTTGGAKWQPGDMVRVLMRGKIWGLWSGTTQVANVVPNVWHSSTTNAQGAFTDAVAATTTGSEVSVGPSWINIVGVRAGTGNIVPLAVNFPGKY